jgi:adenine-specific DNA-methyltransferase
VIFSYFLTPIAQTIIRENRKELGNGLEKFQPNDLNAANMLNISVITEDDRTKIINIYNEIVLDNRSALLDELNTIFLSYLQ